MEVKNTISSLISVETGYLDLLSVIVSGVMMLMIKARHQHALECYATTEQRARGLRQWIQMVIDQVINKDLQTITGKVSRAAHELRVERIRLMKVGQQDGK